MAVLDPGARQVAYKPLPGTAPPPEGGALPNLASQLLPAAALALGVALAAAPSVVLGGLVGTSGESVVGALLETVVYGGSAWIHVTDRAGFTEGCASLGAMQCPGASNPVSSVGASNGRAAPTATARGARCIYKVTYARQLALFQQRAAPLAPRARPAPGYILLQGAGLLSGGSELLLEVVDPGIIGGVLLPCLGALPDALIVLNSGLKGSQEEAAEQLAVGMGGPPLKGGPSREHGRGGWLGVQPDMSPSTPSQPTPLQSYPRHAGGLNGAVAVPGMGPVGHPGSL